MIIDCISDLHGHYPKLEGGDLLIVAGDLTACDDEKEYREFHKWIDKQEYKKKLVIAGNHDNLVQERFEINDIYYTYLCDSGTEFQGLKIWGSPWTKSFKGMNPKCMAFTMEDDCQIGEKFKLIPDDIGILVTHSPPYGILDAVSRWPNPTPENCGSKHLLAHVNRIRPRLHVFGHIHEGHGTRFTMLDPTDLRRKPIYVNASIMNEVYDPINKPIRVIL